MAVGVVRRGEGDEADGRAALVAGCFGTPNYCVNGEIFWGQDRLDYVERRVEELLEQGFKAL